MKLTASSTNVSRGTHTPDGDRKDCRPDETQEEQELWLKDLHFLQREPTKEESDNLLQKQNENHQLLGESGSTITLSDDGDSETGSVVNHYVDLGSDAILNNIEYDDEESTLVLLLCDDDEDEDDNSSTTAEDDDSSTLVLLVDAQEEEYNSGDEENNNNNLFFENVAGKRGHSQQLCNIRSCFSSWRSDQALLLFLDDDIESTTDEEEEDSVFVPMKRWHHQAAVHNSIKSGLLKRSSCTTSSRSTTAKREKRKSSFTMELLVCGDTEWYNECDRSDEGSNLLSSSVLTHQLASPTQ